MSVPKVSFNMLVFIGFSLQYAMMHLLSAGEVIVISSAELILYMVLTCAGLGRYFRRRRQVLNERGCGATGLFSACYGRSRSAPSSARRIILMPSLLLIH